ncbi:uncharacterized protein N7477_003723 [Penicillium maclennaniae]|uniref:uncharacterized protein n=1 Tax=Penicillium maclennaniae TaxID=1343394 RepID=UPI0025413E38|nr:uncharacterized protein N7477_003723 [Penicillium maclennaniae]KAJ5678090.1 hypothetical protein N7477_003723 [Penicillium maclennaniae]
MAAPPRHLSMMSTNNAGAPQPGASDRQQISQQALTPQPTQGLRVPSNRKTIYDRHLNRSRHAESSRASFAYLFGEMVTYAQRRVTGIQDLEKRPTPPRPPLLPLHVHIILSTLQLIYLFIPAKSPPTHHHSPPFDPWPALAPALSTLRRCPRALLNTYISVPREMSMLNCAAFVAGIIEGVCDGCGFEAKVSAHNQPTEMWPSRTVFLVRFGDSVMEREKVLERNGVK